MAEELSALPSGRVIVVYHYPCPDGAYGALAAWLALKELDTVGELLFHPMTVWGGADARAGLLDALTSDTTVLMVDFSGSSKTEPLIPAVAAASKRVILIDHHKTAAEELAAMDDMPPNFESTIRMDMSGATLAWQWFESRMGERYAPDLVGADRDRVKELFAYVEDRDIWRNALEATKEFSTGLSELQLEYDPAKNAAIWDTLLSLHPETLKEKGAVKLKEIQAVIDDELSRTFIVNVPYGDGDDSVRFLAVQPDNADYRSDMGNQLAKLSADRGLAGMGGIIYVQDGMQAGSLKMSIRAIGEQDSTRISRFYGGGGHAGASSFIVEEGIILGWREEEEAEG
eukprot:PLAT3973.1.p1 GENE.PLAT3973.1~~PLAT3973.1.p1  ORF type:complete len:343 (-),score=163.98 PLAT3973.1:51-1079(-)